MVNYEVREELFPEEKSFLEDQLSIRVISDSVFDSRSIPEKRSSSNNNNLQSLEITSAEDLAFDPADIIFNTMQEEPFINLKALHPHLVARLHIFYQAKLWLNKKYKTKGLPNDAIPVELFQLYEVRHKIAHDIVTTSAQPSRNGQVLENTDKKKYVTKDLNLHPLRSRGNLGGVCEVVECLGGNYEDVYMEREKINKEITRGLMTYRQIESFTILLRITV
ncbi:4815_t:CDS:2 [Funneliformis caledonium]|uniref:4815_t:CDS:1 n=1 Tax=Funneliformis caledonium TaxID=1117310 RepID=A0A9N8Z5K7_9GLOM|nr:4815_t:CDS:2 [Funneliformis caledonium]